MVLAWSLKSGVKTGAREVVFQSYAEEYVKRIYDMRKLELGEAPAPDEVIFCHKDGTSD